MSEAEGGAGATEAARDRYRSGDQRRSPTEHRVAFAVLSLAGLWAGSNVGDALLEAWAAPVTVTRYGRMWHMSRPRMVALGVVGARIGFEREGHLQTSRWDEETEDFTEQQLPGGEVVPFVVRTRDGLVAFRIKPPTVRPTTFVGALTDLLLNFQGGYTWELRLDYREQDYASWRSGVERIDSANFLIERPNPHYADNNLIERLLEGLNSARSRLTAQAPTGEGINDEDELFQQLLDHVRRYGRARLVGSDDAEGQVEWLSEAGGAIPRTTRVGSQSGQLSLEELAVTLEDPQQVDSGGEEAGE